MYWFLCVLLDIYNLIVFTSKTFTHFTYFFIYIPQSINTGIVPQKNQLPWLLNQVNNEVVTITRVFMCRASYIDTKFFVSCHIFGKNIHMFFFFFNFILFLSFTILYWFCQISKWIHHRYARVPHPEYSYVFHTKE